jgi:hypothetical protein
MVEALDVADGLRALAVCLAGQPQDGPAALPR